MENIQYGPVSLNVIVTQRFHRVGVYDASGHRILTRWEIEAICNYQPAMVSYDLPNPFPALPVAQRGNLPGQTDLATLNQLLTPCQLLTVTAGGSIVLQTPTTVPPNRPYPTDAKNGPTCEFVSVPKMIGIRHWVVHVRFVAHTNDCTESTSIVLSNTWTSTIDVDEFYYPSRLVQGKAILRTDIMRAGHTTANDLRASFFFPVSQNYVRENVNVKLSEDGATLLWSFQDVGRCYNVAQNSPIRKVDVFRSTYSRAGAGGLAVRQVTNETELRTIELVAGGNANAQSIMGTAVRSGASLFRVAQHNMPQHVLNIRCDVWGDRNGSNGQLTRLSLGICLNQGIASTVPFSITSAEVMCRQELSNRFVSSEITYRWADQFSMPSPFVGLQQVVLPTSVQGQNAQGGVTMLNSLFLEYPVVNARSIPTNALFNVLTQANGLNPQPPSGCFSTLVEQMVVQALLQPCQAVPSPAVLTNNS